MGLPFDYSDDGAFVDNSSGVNMFDPFLFQENQLLMIRSHYVSDL